MKTLRQTYWFFSGKYQRAPRWLDKLPKFFQPIYIGNDEFRWLHCVIKVKYPVGGETLPMAWRRHFRAWRKRNERAPVPSGFVEVDLPYDEGGLAKPWHIDPVLINAMTKEGGDE